MFLWIEKYKNILIFGHAHAAYVVRGLGGCHENECWLVVVVTSFVEPQRNLRATYRYLQCSLIWYGKFGEDCMCAFVVSPPNGQAVCKTNFSNFPTLRFCLGFIFRIYHIILFFLHKTRSTLSVFANMQLLLASLDSTAPS